MKRLLAASLALALSTHIAGAHSDRLTTVPANGASVAGAPEAVQFAFEEAIRLTRIQLSHAAGGERDLELGDQQDFATEFSVPLADNGSGSYRIEWRGLGIDGHPVNGSFTFVVE